MNMGTFSLYFLQFLPNFFIRCISSYNAIRYQTMTNTIATINIGTMGNIIRKPKFISILPRYTGCLIFEYTPLVTSFLISCGWDCGFPRTEQDFDSKQKLKSTIGVPIAALRINRPAVASLQNRKKTRFTKARFIMSK